MVDREGLLKVFQRCWQTGFESWHIMRIFQNRFLAFACRLAADNHRRAGRSNWRFAPVVVSSIALQKLSWIYPGRKNVTQVWDPFQTIERTKFIFMTPKLSQDFWFRTILFHWFSKPFGWTEMQKTLDPFWLNRHCKSNLKVCQEEIFFESDLVRKVNENFWKFIRCVDRMFQNSRKHSTGLRSSAIRNFWWFLKSLIAILVNFQFFCLFRRTKSFSAKTYNEN